MTSFTKYMKQFEYKLVFIENPCNEYHNRRREDYIIMKVYHYIGDNGKAGYFPKSYCGFSTRTMRKGTMIRLATNEEKLLYCIEHNFDVKDI